MAYDLCKLENYEVLIARQHRTWFACSWAFTLSSHQPLVGLRCCTPALPAALLPCGMPWQLATASGKHACRRPPVVGPG